MGSDFHTDWSIPILIANDFLPLLIVSPGGLVNYIDVNHSFHLSLSIYLQQDGQGNAEKSKVNSTLYVFLLHTL